MLALRLQESSRSTALALSNDSRLPIKRNESADGNLSGVLEGRSGSVISHDCSCPVGEITRHSNMPSLEGVNKIGEKQAVE